MLPNTSDSYRTTGIPENHHDYLAAAETHRRAALTLQRKGYPLNHPLVQHHLEQNTNAARSASIRQP